ncbi:MAG: zinc ribbon domain-containing protein [Gammaproteobacteria bacterium]|nr:zinc ribbon domain-containing protein [Gammaproteobacteria bacterium]
MPIYEYVCETCDHTHDALQKINDAPLTDCPNCEAPSLKKKISAPGFRLSGSGWYETDFKSSNKRNIADKGSNSDSSSAHSCGTGGCASCS